MSNVLRSFMAQAARGGRSRRNFSSLPEESTGGGMRRELLRVATGLSVGYFIGFLFHHNKLAAEKEAIRRRQERFKRFKLCFEKDTSETSLKNCRKELITSIMLSNV